MMTVSQLARSVGLSRTALLYYEKEGLLSPSVRGENGYRYYSDADAGRLQCIVSYRSFGLPISDIHKLLQTGKGHTEIAQSHFLRLEGEIQVLRRQQYAVVNLLRAVNEDEKDAISRDKWVELMREAGLNDDEMNDWHRQFESMAPEDHEEFLKILGFDATGRKRIRLASRSGSK